MPYTRVLKYVNIDMEKNSIAKLFGANLVNNIKYIFFQNQSMNLKH